MVDKGVVQEVFSEYFGFFYHSCLFTMYHPDLLLLNYVVIMSRYLTYLEFVVMEDIKRNVFPNYVVVH
jgi:hypothetical protein